MPRNKSRARTPRATPRPIARVLVLLDGELTATGDDVVVAVDVVDCGWDDVDMEDDDDANVDVDVDVDDVDVEVEVDGVEAVDDVVSVTGVVADDCS